MSRKRKFKELLNSFLKLDWIPKTESFRQALVMMFGVDEIPDDTMAWCAKFMKDEIADIEFYIDEMCIYCARELKRIGKFTEENFVRNMIYGMNLAVNHELIHIFGNIKNEAIVELITKKLLKEVWMGWHWIPCPKLLKDVTWIECLQCGDAQKHPSCPFRNVRIDASPREYEIGTYHVTELPHVLYSYFERTNPYSRAWIEYYDMLYGKALGWYLESRHAHHCQEVSLKLESPDKDFKIVGSADLVLDKANRLVELKFYYSISKLVRQNAPNDEHTFQVQAYYTMGLKYKPWLFEKLDRITIVYYSKMKSRKLPRRKEFEVEVKTIEQDMLTPARTLHKALVSKKPPLDHKCPDWLCGYCKHLICPFHPRRGNEK